jgi:xylose dehydrogenase (NAD/NADP)
MDVTSSFQRFQDREWLDADPCGRVRFALIGLGGFTREWVLPAVADSSFAEARCLVSGSKKKAKDLADNFGVAHALTYEEFLDGDAADAYDALYVATPNALHLPYVKHAAEYGKDVLCEKPMEATVKRAKAMVDTCEDAGVTLMIAYRLQVNPVVRWARYLVREGAIGSPVHVRGAMSQHIFETITPDPNQWRLDPALSGGAALIDLGLYPLNLTRFMLDVDPQDVTAQVQNRADAFEGVDETVAFTVSYDDGTLGSYTASQNARRTSHLHVTGTDGAVRFEPAFFGHTPLTIEVEGVTTTLDAGAASEIREEFDYFASHVLCDAPVEPDGRHGLVDLRTIERLYNAAGINGLGPDP